MAVGLSATVANAILDALLRSTTWSEPAAVWVKLHTGDPGAAGTSNPATETTRKQATFAAASNGVTTTTADLDWTGVAATESYSHWSAWDASTGGNFLFSDQLDAPVAVGAGQDFTILAGDIDVDLSVIAS